MKLFRNIFLSLLLALTVVNTSYSQVLGNKIIPVTESGAITWADISTSVYNSNFIGTNPPELDPAGIWMKPDGTKMYITGDSGVRQWDLSIPFDITTATDDSKAYAFARFSNAGIWMSDDGTKLFIARWNPARIYRADLSVAWDISTATAHSDTGGLNSGTRDVFLKSDGTKIYILYETTKLITEYNLGTAFDLTTMSAAINSLDFSTEIDTGGGAGYRFFMKPDDGLKVYVCKVSGSNIGIYQYSGTAGWDVSTFTYDSDFFLTSGIDTGNRGIYFKPDGTKWYMAGITIDRIYELDF